MKLETLVLAVIIPCSIAWTHAAQNERNDSIRTLSVNGTAEVFVRPDRATVRLGVQADAKKAADAQNEVNKTLNRILEALAKQRITRQMIQTSTIRLHPLYEEENPPRSAVAERKETGFRAEHTLEVTLIDLGEVGDILDASLAAGANRIQSVSFELQNDLEPRLSALRMAVKDARAKARAIADELSVEIRSVHQGSGPEIGCHPHVEKAGRSELWNTV